MSFSIVLCINMLKQDLSLNETLTIFGELPGSACLYSQILGLQPVKPCLTVIRVLDVQTETFRIVQQVILLTKLLSRFIF